MPTIEISQANSFFFYIYCCLDRHWIEHRYFLPHDAILQLRRASHLWAWPEDLLPVRFQEVTGWPDKLSLESAPKNCGGCQCCREVRHVGCSYLSQGGRGCCRCLLTFSSGLTLGFQCNNACSRLTRLCSRWDIKMHKRTTYWSVSSLENVVIIHRRSWSSVCGIVWGVFLCRRAPSCLHSNVFPAKAISLCFHILISLKH